jgi:fermentation-respiration switch protein FrsA (DUF1100 family)
VPPRNPADFDKDLIPEGKIYEPYRPQMEEWSRQTAALPRQDFKITSFDGLELWGSYFEYEKGAPIELMFHGYRGNAQRDLSGGVQRCFSLGRNALLVDQRCSRRSGGNVITFGIKEHKDCLAWVDFIVSHFGDDVKIILTGISMGAATVMTAAGCPLPKNVVGVLADCGFNSPRDIIKKVIKQMRLPVNIGYFFVKLGAKIFGGFDPEECSPLEAVARCDRPVIFFHGEGDDFVPCYMSREVYEACPGKKAIYTVPGADHGLSFPVDMDGYVAQLQAFFGPDASAE